MMKNRAYLWICLSLSACASGPQPVSISLDPLTAAASADRNSTQDGDRLRRWIKKNPGDQVLVSDVLNSLEAGEAENKGDFNAAISKWRATLGTAQDALGDRAFNGWLRSYVRLLGRKVKINDLARMVLQEFQNGSGASWLAERQLTTEEKLLPILLREVPEAIEAEPSVQDATIDAPGLTGIPIGDPLLLKLSSDVCVVKSRYGKGWVEWRASLLPEVEKYFDALVLQCSGQVSKTVTILSDIAPRLASHSATAGLALESFARMIRIRRDQGERESVAPLYVPFMQLWKSPSVNEQALGMTRSD
jgi:hypothetical protein